MNKENDSSRECPTERSGSTLEKVTSPLKDLKLRSNGFARNEEYYLDKLKAQREKVSSLQIQIELLIGEFSKLTDALEERDSQIERLRDYKEKYEELKLQWEALQKTHTEQKRDQLQLKQENDQLRNETRELRADTEKERLRGDIRCLQERVNFFEGRAETLHRSNLQLKEEKEALTNQLQNQKEEFASQLRQCREKHAVVLSDVQEATKVANEEMSSLRQALSDKMLETTRLHEQLKEAQLTVRTEALRHENEIKQINQSMQLKEKQHSYQIESLEQQLQEAAESLERREQQLQKCKAEVNEKRGEQERLTEKLDEIELKLKAAHGQLEQSRFERQNNEEVRMLRERLAQLEQRNREYEEYLHVLQSESMEEEKIRKEFEMKRNLEVDRIEKIFNRIRARGIDLVEPNDT